MQQDREASAGRGSARGRGGRLRKRVVAAAGRVATRLTPVMRQDRVLAAFGAGPACQIAVLPGDLSGLVDPVVHVRTDAIRWGGRPPRRHRDRGLRVVDGDWDIVCKQPIEAYLRTDVYGRSVEELFVEGRHHTETHQYRRMVARLEQGQTPKRCTSLEDIDAYFGRLEDAFRSIVAEGYKSQAELGTGRPHDEIAVYVDRAGELHKQHGSGHHRLAIARLLGMSPVPVAVIGVHRQWVERCARRFGGSVVHAIDLGIAELAAPAAPRTVGRRPSRGPSGRGAAPPAS